MRYCPNRWRDRRRHASGWNHQGSGHVPRAGTRHDEPHTSKMQEQIQLDGGLRTKSSKVRAHDDAAMLRSFAKAVKGCHHHTVREDLAEVWRHSQEPYLCTFDTRESSQLVSVSH